MKPLRELINELEGWNYFEEVMHCLEWINSYSLFFMEQFKKENSDIHKKYFLEKIKRMKDMVENLELIVNRVKDEENE